MSKSGLKACAPAQEAEERRRRAAFLRRGGVARVPREEVGKVDLAIAIYVHGLDDFLCGCLVQVVEGNGI